MGLYEKIIAERAEEGRPLGMFHNLDSPALDRLLADSCENLPRYSADMHRLYQYVHRGVHSQGGAMQLASLKKKHAKAYDDLKAEARGQQELL